MIVKGINEVTLNKSARPDAKKSVELDNKFLHEGNFDTAFRVSGISAKNSIAQSQLTENEKLVKAILNNKFVHINPEEVVQQLRKRQVPEDRIKSLRNKFGDELFGSVISSLLLFTEDNPIVFWPLLEGIRFSSLNSDNINKFYEDNCIEANIISMAYINEKNIKLLEKVFLDRHSAIDALSAIGNYMICDKKDKERLLFQAFDILSVIYGDLRNILFTLKKSKNAELYTVERISALKNLIDALNDVKESDEFKSKSTSSKKFRLDFSLAKYIKNPENITPEFINEYKNVIKKILAQRINVPYLYENSFFDEKLPTEMYDPEYALNKYKTMLSQMDKYGLNFSWYINKFRGNDRTHFSSNKLCFSQIDWLLSRDNLEKSGELLSKYTRYAKEYFSNIVFNSLGEQDCLEDVDGFAELFNLVSEVSGNDESLTDLIYKVKNKETVNVKDALRIAKTFLVAGGLPCEKSCVALFPKVKDCDALISFIEELKNFYTEDSKYSISDYIHLSQWVHGDYNKMSRKFRILKENGLYGKISPSDLREILKDDGDDILNFVLKYNSNPIIRENVSFLSKNFGGKFLLKYIGEYLNKFEDDIRRSNPEFNDLPVEDIEKILIGLGENLIGSFYQYINSPDTNKRENYNEEYSIKNKVRPQLYDLCKLLFVKNDNKFKLTQMYSIRDNLFKLYSNDSSEQDAYSAECFDYSLRLLQSELSWNSIIEKLSLNMTDDKDEDALKELLNDAYANRDLLKTGQNELSDTELQFLINRKQTLKALKLFGKGTLESAFSMNETGFYELCNEISKLKLSSANREKLLQKINPRASKKYEYMNKSLMDLKKTLSLILGEDVVKKINVLNVEKKQIDEKLVQLSNDIKNAKKIQSNAKETALKLEYKKLFKQSKNLQRKIQNLYLTSENTSEVKDLMMKIKLQNKNIKEFLNEYSDFTPQEILDKVRVLAAISSMKNKEVARFIDLIKPSTFDKDKVWARETNKILYDLIAVEGDEFLYKKLDLIHCKYLCKLVTSLSRNNATRSLARRTFSDYFRTLVKIIKDTPDKTVEEAIDSLPQNIETKKQFAMVGIDYEKWTKFNPKSFSLVQVKLDSTSAQKSAIESLEKDLNSNLFAILPTEVKNEIFVAMNKIGISLKKSDDGEYHLFKKDKPVEFSDMRKIISSIRDTINANDFWTTKHLNPEIDAARGTMYDHLIKLRKAQVLNAKSIKKEEVVDLKVSKTNMYDIKKAIGLGNDAQCCTALGGHFNEYTAPTYIMNKCIGAIELTDKGNYVGNTMIYIADVDDEVSLVLDNIELKSKYHNNDAIRDVFIDYAKKLCNEIGRPDLPIYACKYRQQVDFSDFPKNDRWLKIIGSSNDDEIYLDFDAQPHVIGRELHKNVKLYKIR